MITNDKTKAECVEEEILKQIKIGNYARGALLPSERKLAKNFNVSYMTARKAVDKLVEKNYVERISSKGTFVRQDISENRIQKQVGIICPTWESPEASDSVMYASEEAERNNFIPKVFYSRFWGDKVILDAWDSCDALIIIPPQPLNEIPEALLNKFSSNEKPLVFIGVPAHKLGIDTVMGNSEKEISMAVDVLKKAGHSKIAFIDNFSIKGNKEEHTNNSLYHEWKEIITSDLGDKVLQELYLGVELPNFTLPYPAIYNKIKNYRNKDLPFTALILNMDILWATMAAFLDLGFNIPEDLSIIAIGDRLEAEFYRPVLSHIRVSREKHMKKAFVALKNRLSDEKQPAQFFYIKPEIVKGKTIKKI